jgi:NodT family efflux transporter outer membrane factor (OMF) lipoprotein
VDRSRSLASRAFRLSAAPLVLTGCFSIGPDHEAPTIELNAAWSAADDAAFQAVPQPRHDEWWKSFEDEVLIGLVDEALAQNLSLENSALRVLQARVGRRLSYQALIPLPLAGGSYAHVDLSQNVEPDVEVDIKEIPKAKTVHIPGGPLKPEGKTIVVAPDISLPEVRISDELDIYEVGLDAIWEVDLWGKKRRGIDAATAEVEAALATYSDGLVRLAGEVAATYVRLRILEQRAARLAADAERLRDTLAIAERRHRDDAVPELDVLQLRALLAESEADLPRLEAGVREARNAICFLVGRSPGYLDARLAASTAIPRAPASIALGIPADLLRRRPDVRRAERIAAAECERIGMRKSELYPQFSLFGSLGYAASDSGDLFDDDSKKGAYGVGLKWNILLYTVIMDAARLQDAQYQEALYAYQETVLRAAKEVDDGSAALRAAQRRTASLDEALVAEERAVTLSLEMYERGEVDLWRVLDAQRTIVRLHEAESESRGAQAIHAIALYKALGGGWENVDEAKILDEATWEALSSRTDWDWYRPASEATSSQGDGGEP